MIIKTDFVTNSSSTIYIVYIPKNYPITLKKMIDKFNEQKKFYNEEDWAEYNSPAKIKNIFNIGLDRLKNQEYLYSWDEELPTMFWQALLNLLEDEGLIIQQIESGVSGDDALAPIKKDSIEKIIKTETLYGGEK
jgi:hypothetical protein